MTSKLLHTAVQDFIQANLNTPLDQLAFKKNPFPDIPYVMILEQIDAKKKSKDKLPTWYQTPGILYPKKLSIEQTSSETAAAYKASLISGQSLIDLTGGFGVDSFYFSKQVQSVLHCEYQSDLSKIVQHNFEVLNVNNVAIFTGDSLHHLQNHPQKWDWIYIDPARRDNQQQKVFQLKDCEPSIPDHLDEYFLYTDRIMLKTAPLLDIHAGYSELRNVKEVHVVAIDNEVKELIWILDKTHQTIPTLFAINLGTDTSVVELPWRDHNTATFSMPSNYLYEPNASLMKSGKFNTLSSLFELDKLHPHSHLYTSKNVKKFPGRTFRILQTFPYSNKTGKHQLQKIKANIATRNFPLKVNELKKLWKIQDGGDLYLFFTTNFHHERIVLFCEKIN